MIKTYEEYIVEPKNSCVICKMKIVNTDKYCSILTNYISINCDSDKSYKIQNGLRELLSSRTEYVGVARLKDGDKCDYEKGQKIARCKALRSFYKKYARWTRAAEDLLYNELFKLEKYTDGLFDHIAYLDDNIKKTAYDEVNKNE